MLAQLLKNFYICTFFVLVDKQKQEVVTDCDRKKDSAH